METAGYIASILIGLSLGLIGGGGSILTVPILVYFFRTDPVLATTYSLFVVGITSAVGAVSHYRKNNVNFKIALIFGIPSLFAVFTMRKWVMPAIPDQLFNLGSFELTKSILLMLVFALLMLAASVSMIKKSKATATIAVETNYFRLVFQSIVVGVITGFVGVGGGFLIIPSLVLFAGLPMKKAVGTSLMIMAISSLLGVLGDVSRHIAIDYSFLTTFCLFAVSGILAGSYLSAYVPDAKLKPAFGGLFVLVSTIYK